jgi:hypothetical protein
MLTNPQPPRIHLPKGWQAYVKSAVLHAIALAHYAIVYGNASGSCWITQADVGLDVTLTRRIVKSFDVSWHLLASIAFVVLQCPSTGHLEAIAL